MIGTWTEQGRMSTDDEIGGDTQAGECYSRRYTHPDRPGAVIDVHFYVIGPNARGREIQAPHPVWAVHCAAEYTVCDDVTRPGDTEQWSDTVYAAAPERETYADQDTAETGAHSLAEAFDPTVLTWDGQPFTGDAWLRAYPYAR